MEPRRSLHDIVTIRNVDIDDFTFEYGRAEGNYPYVIKAGAIARFPRFLAKHAMKHMINQILNRKGIRTDNESARAELQNMIFVEEEVFQQAPEEAEGDRMKKQIEELNKPSDLEAVLARHKEKTKPVNPSNNVVVGVGAPNLTGTTPEVSDKPDEEVFAGVEDERVARKKGFAGSEIDLTDDKPATPVAKPKPTRAELFSYAAKQGLVLDEKDDKGSTLRSKLEKMKIDEVIKELDYPLK